MEISLKGRAALITGGSEGLGKGMAIRFAQSGADVAILARARCSSRHRVRRVAASWVAWGRDARVTSPPAVQRLDGGLTKLTPDFISKSFQRAMKGA